MIIFWSLYLYIVKYKNKEFKLGVHSNIWGCNRFVIEKEVKTNKGPEHKKVVDNLESLEEKIKTIKGIERHQVRRDLLLLRQLSPTNPRFVLV